MKKNAGFGALLALILLLGGCGAPSSPAAPQETATPQPLVTAAPQAQGPLADAVRALMAPYQNSLAAAARKPGAITYSIPGDMLEKMAWDAQAAGAQAQEGRYHFSWRQAGEYTYATSALDVAEIGASAGLTPDPLSEKDPVMDNQQMGDFAASGGGLFDRQYHYDVDAALQNGRIEISDLLNGESTGQEIFTFAHREETLCFVDGILDMAAGLDGLEETERYLVAAGVLRPDGLDIIEFNVPSRDQVPDAQALDWEAFSASVTPLSRLTVP